MVRGWLLWVALCGCGGGGDAPRDAAGDAADAMPDALYCPPTSTPTVPPTGASGTCSPLAQSGCATGEKCTWRSDVNQIACVPSGSMPVGCACSTGAGYDDCVSGAYCQSGICKSICDPQGGNPMCPDGFVCTRYSTLFKPSSTSVAVAGLCNRECDPLADNDFDGAGTLFTKSAFCDAASGCYGFPSGGTPPRTGFGCVKLGSATAVHRSPAPIDPVLGGAVTNACAQGYLPLFYESYAVQTVLCIAMCKPQNCYAGNCGANDENRLGVAPHRCTPSDRLGSFDNAPGAEHCRYLWSLEIDRQIGTFLRSPHSDTVGVCFDHSKFVYDSNNDGQFTATDRPLPACAQLGLTGTHANADLDNPTVFWGASDVPLGCVDTAVAGVPIVAPRVKIAPIPEPRY